jgi:hypothetical protein
MSVDAEFASVLEEMGAEAEWERLDRHTQASWMHWMMHSAETPRVRMYETVNYLREGRTRPPRFAAARTWLSGLFSGPSWW